jgi:hypothetical protein
MNPELVSGDPGSSPGFSKSGAKVGIYFHLAIPLPKKLQATSFKLQVTAKQPIS